MSAAGGRADEISTKTDIGQSGSSVIEAPVGVMPDPWDWIVGKRIRPAEAE
jgi:hypothetical protein